MTSPGVAKAPVLSFPGQWVAYAHTFFLYTAFITAFIIGVSLHYKQLVNTDYSVYPAEWFPSVSATTGDFYPERNVFHIFIALTSPPRFILILLWYVLIKPRGKAKSKAILYLGLVRTLFFGIFAYVSSKEDFNVHELFGLGYLLLTLPWTLGIILMAPPNRRAKKYRKIIAGCLYFTWLPMIIFFIRHMKNIPGSYSFFSLAEWTLVLLEAAFDTVVETIEEEDEEEAGKTNLGNVESASRIEASRARDEGFTKPFYTRSY